MLTRLFKRHVLSWLCVYAAERCALHLEEQLEELQIAIETNADQSVVDWIELRRVATTRRGRFFASKALEYSQVAP